MADYRMGRLIQDVNIRSVSNKTIKLDELSNRYFSLFLKITATGFVSKIFIIIVFGYFFLTSIFSKKLS